MKCQESKIEEVITNADSNIKITDKKKYDNSKIEYVLASNQFMGSLSIVRNYTYDFLIIKINDEELVLSVTKTCNDCDEMLISINNEMIAFKKIIEAH